ncbi:MAG: CHASE2 domain-containing protein [Elusimicrobiota bacterium]
MNKRTDLILLSIVTPALVALMLVAGIGRAVELKTLDWRFLLRGPEPALESIFIVAIGDESVSADVMGRWPWRRGYMASFINVISDYSPSSIVFDIMFTEPSKDFPRDDIMFADEAGRASNVFFPFFLRLEDAPRARGYSAQEDEVNKRLIEKISIARASDFENADFINAQTAVMPISALSAEAAGSGYVNASPDPDGITRRIPLVIRYRDKIIPSIAFSAALDYLGASREEVHINPGKNIVVRSSEREIRIPVDSRQRMLVNHSGEFSSANFPLASFVGLYSDHDQDGMSFLEMIEDRMVFIGLTATGTVDLRPTPFSPVFPMVAFLADGACNIVEGDFMAEAPPWINALIVFFAGLAAAFFTIKFKAFPAALLNAGFLFSYLILNFLFFKNNYVLSAFYPFISIIFTYAGITIYKFTGEEQEKKVIKGMFQRYVSSQVVDTLIDNPELINLGGERRYLTVFFSDIRSFTSISEKMDPEEVVQILNEYLTEMIKIIFKNNGTLDKFMGDAIMAIWGAPVEQEDHALLAVKAAVEMRESLEKLHDKWKKEGRKTISVGMGINTGEVISGNMGSEQFEDYTVIGDTVNLAARLEENAGPGQILVSQETYNHVKEKVIGRPLPAIKVKGKEQKVKIYQIMEFKT